MLDALMLIHREGGPPSEFNFSAAVKSWYEKKNRRVELVGAAAGLCLNFDL